MKQTARLSARIARLLGAAALAGLLAGLLGACAGTPPPPDWKINAQGALESFEKRHLDGDSRLAALSFERARAEISRTGRPELVARAELIRCAVELAALDDRHCAVLGQTRGTFTPADAAYADFLAGRWQGLDTRQLPETYRALVAARDDSSRQAALAAIKAPTSRLIAASVLFRRQNLAPAGIDLAIDTAAERGWRRPLLAWLGVQRQRAAAAGDSAAITALQARIDLVERSLPKSAP